MGKRKRFIKPNWLRVLEVILKLVTTLIEKFGWPGAFLILAYCFIQQYATIEQKSRLVELYLLSRDCTGTSYRTQRFNGAVVCLPCLLGER